jgi:thioredoxin reductase
VPMDSPSTLSSPPNAAPGIALKVQIVVIGAGQAGLSAAYHFKRLGLAPHKGFVVLDQSPGPGGAWQDRWPSLTLSTVNRIHDLPGMSFSEVIGTDSPEVRASVAVPEYFAAYEKRFELPVYRPVAVKVVCDRHDHFRVETDRIQVSARGLINATGAWESPYVPDIPGAERFKGRQLHTKDYRTAQEFSGRHVIVVGAGISAIQLLDEVSRVTTTTWVTRREPEFRDCPRVCQNSDRPDLDELFVQVHASVPEISRSVGAYRKLNCSTERPVRVLTQARPFDEKVGRAAVAIVEDRVRRGLPPASVVSVTGIPVTPAIAAMRARGVLTRRPMFSELTEDGVRWSDGTALRADVILWCTGFRSSLDHLAPLMLRQPGGGIVMTGRLATQVAKDPRVHLVGYGPSASTIGANRAGRAAAEELMAFLELG